MNDSARTNSLVARISRLEWICAGIAVIVFVGLVIAEPDIVQAPWESERAIAATVGGTILAALALVGMLRFGVPPVVRVLVLGVPLVATSWWLISPFFRDTVGRDKFSTSIAAAKDQPSTPSTTAASTPPTSGTVTTLPPVPAGPQLLGSGTFVGLAGHRGSGDAGIFRLENGSLTLRLENLDIQNGPDLELYLVPGTDRRAPDDASHHFGELRGNVGELTYDVPTSFSVAPGPWTVLVYCKAFTVEFVAANITVT